MNATYDDFTNALEYLVSIEADPDTYADMDEYDVIMAPYETKIQMAHATIREYGAQIAPLGLEHMQFVLYDFIVDKKSDHKAYSVMESVVNSRWDGLGEWRG